MNAQDIFYSIIDSSAAKCSSSPIALTASLLDTPLGFMIAVGSDTALYFLDFIDRPDINRRFGLLQAGTQSSIIAGRSSSIASIKAELGLYFAGKLTEFKTPLYEIGTSFQKSVWQSLNQIAYGATHSYTQQAVALGRTSAHRAVANACGANNIVIAIPCHRVVRNNGYLGGYAGGIWRKQWLIEHEHKYRSISNKFCSSNRALI